mmetsp:Transcript_16915/g.12013  ORF Transcript_16915/g.12013 Transcript_16915/m.12013 type:complete len:107 (+) Transcript_16915:2041-2361(+)
METKLRLNSKTASAMVQENAGSTTEIFMKEVSRTTFTMVKESSPTRLEVTTMVTGKTDLQQEMVKKKFASTDFYKGEFVKGKPDGYGVCDYKNGNKYAGNWKANTL